MAVMVAEAWVVVAAAGMTVAAEATVVVAVDMEARPAEGMVVPAVDTAEDTECLSSLVS